MSALSLFLLVFSVSALEPQAIRGTAGVWNFNEPSGAEAANAAGGSYAGLAYGTVIVPGRYGLARSFNGSTDVVAIQGTSGLNFTSGGFTLEAWFKTITADGYDRFIVGKYDWSNKGNNGYFLDIVPLTGRVGFFVGSDPRLQTAGAYNDGQWHHAAGTYDGERQRLYVDGVLAGERVQRYPVGNEAEISIGGALPNPYGDYTSAAFLGTIDGVRVLSYAAESGQIARDAAGSPKRRPASPPAVAVPAYPSSPHGDVLPVRRGKPRPDDFALVVGVERYRSLPAASYAERDASAFARYARAVLGVPEENTILLTGERATKTDIAKYVEEWLPRNVVEASRVYVFYSGHGAPDPAKGTAHLVPWDGDPAFLQTSAYSLGRLYDRLLRLKAREVVVMLDACFSGVGGRSVIAPGLRPLVLVQEAVVPKGDKLTVLTAASSDETAGSLDSQRHGLFTYYLLKGLDGAADPEGSGHVDVGGLHGYVRQNVLRAARRQNREQNPVLRTPDKRLRLY